MWQQVAVFLASFFLAGFHVVRNLDPTYLFFWIPLNFLIVLYFFVIEDRFSILVTIGLALFLIVYGAYQTHSAFYFSFALALALAVWGVFSYVLYWNRRIGEVEEKKRSMRKETEALRVRHQARVDSLKHLEQRVAGLVHLFEIARDFNECLDFSEMLTVLNQKIAHEFSFARGTLILLEFEPTTQSNQQVNQCFSFGLQKRDDQALLDQFADECLKALAPSEEVNKAPKEEAIKLKVIDVNEKPRFIPYDVKFPLWLFPLSVEHQLAAILAIEGGVPNDFQRFEVLASQLALQVKKVGLYETVKRTSILDGLTNVFVRRHFIERFQEELKRALRYQFPLSVLMVDVDHFKSYNDKFGHLVGDKTLREVAQVIRENVRRVDVIGRYGGEEFIVVAPEIGKKQGLELAERIRLAAAQKHFHLYDEETQVTVSIGISSFPEDLQSTPPKEFSETYLPVLIHKADQALYQAKEKGRNRIVVYGSSGTMAQQEGSSE